MIQRRLVFSCSLVLLAAMFSLAFAAPPAVWPCQDGGPERQGVSPVRLPSAPTVAWKTEVPGVFDYGFSSPTVDAQHRIYIATERADGYDQDGYISAVSAQGQVLWTTPMAKAAATQPVVLASGMLAVQGLDGRVSVYRDSGELAWSKDFPPLEYFTLPQPLPDPSGDFYLIDASPAVSRIGADGAARWTVALTVAPSLPTLGDGKLYVPLTDGRVLVLNAADGAQLGERELGGGFQAFPSYKNGWLYFKGSSNNDAQLQAIQLGAGVLPAFPVEKVDYTSQLAIVPSGDLVVACRPFGTDTQSVIAAYGATGGKKWSATIGPYVYGQLVTDASGAICFTAKKEPGLSDMGELTVYALAPDHSVAWHVVIDNEAYSNAAVFPIADGLLGAVDVDNTKHTSVITAIGK